MRKAIECRDGRVAIVTGRDHKEFDKTLRELWINHDRSLPQGPKIILHVIPKFALIRPEERSKKRPYSVEKLAVMLRQPETASKLKPLSRYTRLSNFEHSVSSLTCKFNGFASLEIFRTGFIEAVDRGTYVEEHKEHKYLLYDDLEEECSQAVGRLLSVLADLNFTSTTCLFLTLTDVQGIEFTTAPFGPLIFRDRDCKAAVPIVYVPRDVEANALVPNLMHPLCGCADPLKPKQ